MNFLNAVLLGGAAVLLAPLLIHLLNRSRFQTVPWGAMHLLNAALETNSRRFQWESWLLLLIRCLIPVLLAVTLARPVLTHIQPGGADNDVSLALLLDNSASMAASERGESLLERGARELARIAELARGAELSLWTTARPATDLLSGNTLSLPRLRTALQRIGSPAGSNLATSSLQIGLHQPSALKQPSRQVVLASDFQAAQWREITDNELQALHSQLDNQDSPIQLFLLPLRTTSTPPNLSIEIVDAPQMARLDQSFQLAASVKNHNSQAVDDIRVTFQVGGQDMVSRTVQLAAGASEQVPFACEFTELGWQHLAVSVNDPGSVHGDDVCYHVVQVAAPPKVLIIDDSLDTSNTADSAKNVRRHNPAFKGDSRYLQLALSPFAEAKRNPFAVQRARAVELPQLVLAEFDAVIVAGLVNATPTVLDSLSAYVRGGGGLLIFADQELSSAAWKQWESNTTALLPMSFGQVRMPTAAQPAKLAVANNAVDPASFLQLTASGLNSFQFTRWLELIPIDAQPNVRVLSKFSSGEPWLVERDVGSGLVIQCASGCGDVGSNLPSQPAFVPLMLSLADRIVVRTARSAQVLSGNSVVLQVIDRLDDRQPSSSRSQIALESTTSISVSRIAPTNASQPSSLESAISVELPVQEGRASFSDTRLPGVYAAKLPTSRTSQPAVEPALLSVNTPRVESQLAPLSESELSGLATRLGATLIQSADDYGHAEKLRRDGWEIWRWLLIGVLGLLFAELYIGLRSATQISRGV